MSWSSELAGSGNACVGWDLHLANHHWVAVVVYDVDDDDLAHRDAQRVALACTTSRLHRRRAPFLFAEQHDLDVVAVDDTEPVIHVKEPDALSVVRAPRRDPRRCPRDRLGD